MKFFIDTANIEEIKKANDLGIICGVTTNPSLIAKEGKDFKEVVKEITTIVDGPISAEPVSLEADKMIEEAQELIKIHPNIVIKLPITPEGLKACKVLSAQGVKINVTLIFSANQALMAARAGAAYVSPFVGRIDDINHDGIALIDDIAQMFAIHDINSEIIAASIRSTMHVSKCALAGADIATIPYKVIEGMFNHPLTDKGIENFKKDWENAFNK
ncbi:MAG: fructose-6-phosphate aldolase [Erysipelotrichales bacterium]